MNFKERYLVFFILVFSSLVILSCEESEQIKPNHNPEIISFGVIGGGVQASDIATFFCLVEDEDNDSLEYFWTAPEGSFHGSGDTIYWKAPNETSLYPISCRVEDGRGGYAEINFDVQVFPNRLFSDSAWTVYNSSNTDLPPYSIDYLWSVEVDRSGQVWMGDHSGNIHKYDGVSWQTYNLYSSESFESINFDSQDHLWLIFEGGQLIEFYDGVFTHHNRYDPDHPRKYYATNTAIDKDDNVWVAFPNSSGPSKFNGSYWQDFESLGLPGAQDIAIDQYGDIWYTADTALVHYDHSSWEVFEGPVPQWKQSIAIDSQDRVWVATETHELALYDQHGWTYFPTPFEGNDGWINDLIVDADNNIWCACDGGIAILDSDLAQLSGSIGWQTVITPDNSSLPDGWITSLSIDPDGNIWGGAHAYGASTSGGGGLFKIDLSND